MKKLINNVVVNPFLLLIVLLKDVYETIILIINSNLKTMDYFDFAIKVFICIMFIVLAKHYIKLKNEQKIISDIIKFNAFENFTSNLDGDKETIMKLFSNHRKQQYNKLKQYLQNKYSDKSAEYIENILKEFF